MMREILTYNGPGEFIQSTEVTHDGILVIKNEQDLEPTVEALKYLKKQDDYASQGIKAGWMHVGHVPDVIVHKWFQEGFDIDRHSVKEIVARLHAEHLTDFLATNKRF